MSLLDRLADAHIESAAQRGEFDDLPGAGKPLPADDAAHVPEHLRAGYRLLKNAGYVPPEIESRRELREVEDLLARTLPESDEARQLTRRARWIELQLAQSPRGRALLRESGYSNCVRKRLAASRSHSNSGR
ncbi:DnaJ family domain-containing protein [Salinisphaera hydrothermalis]|uniref:DnaJ family domain-containing protein n=1 Tax=Salinisphaera hydrothermalis TaxID=563188 RepID=UPI00333F5214